MVVIFSKIKTPNMVEKMIYKQEVVGLNPVTPTNPAHAPVSALK